LVDQCCHRLEVEITVVVGLGNPPLKRLVVGGVGEIFADRLDQQLGPVGLEELGDGVESVDKILRGLEMDSPGVVARAYTMCMFCT